MRARIPAGIDLEDRLLYGLSPVRLGYVAGLAVIAIWFWRRPFPVPARILPAAIILGAAAAIGWMRYEGRNLDRWVEDSVRYLVRRYRIEWVPSRAARVPRPQAPLRDEPARPRLDPAEIPIFVLASGEPP